MPRDDRAGDREEKDRRRGGPGGIRVSAERGCDIHRHDYLGPEGEWWREPDSLTSYFSTPREAVSYIMDTFPLVLEKDLKAHGTYRAKDRILEIYDNITEAIRVGRPYQTPRDARPGRARRCASAKANVSNAREFGDF